MLYVLTMHIVNNLTSNKANQYNDPDRAEFFRAHKISVSFLSLVSALGYLLISFSLGLLPFAIILLMSFTGLSYNLKLVPRKWFSGESPWDQRYSRFKNLFCGCGLGGNRRHFPRHCQSSNPIKFYHADCFFLGHGTGLCADRLL